MTIPNVVLGELIDPVTFGNAVVDAVNEHETEIADRLPLSGGTITGDLEVDGYLRTNGTTEQGCFITCEPYSAEYIEFDQSLVFGQLSLWGNTISTTGSALLHYRSGQGYVVLGGSRMRTLDGTLLDTAGSDTVENVTVAPTGTTYSGLTVVPWSNGSRYRIYIENNTSGARSWVGLWTGLGKITGNSPGASRSAMEAALAMKELNTGR